jgi:ribosome assembly protein RRB1
MQDNSVAVWDLALERDQEEEAKLAARRLEMDHGAPAQLLFLHAGQHDIKEVHWHCQIPGLLVSTAADCFNIFKPSNMFESPSPTKRRQVS